tara:strand:+ start:545 stop:1114 length:570 start_codon:yes stop_codon:yes gene_type:complete
MSRILVDQIRSNSASADAITLDGSGNITFPANATCSGTATGFGGGKFLQIVGAVQTSNVAYNSTSTYADTGLTCNITTSASGHAGVLVLVSGSLGGIGTTSGGESAAIMNLVRDSTELTFVSNGSWAGNVSGQRVSNHNSQSLIYFDSGTSASTTYTYKCQYKKTSDTVNAFWNNYNGRSLIYLIEVGS